MIKLIFCVQINVKGFFILPLSLYVREVRHAQIAQNNKFAISQQYLKKEVSYEADFIHAVKHESQLQIDTMIVMGMVKHSQSSKNSQFAMSLQYPKKEVKDEVDFLHADKHQNFYKLISIIWA